MAMYLGLVFLKDKNQVFRNTKRVIEKFISMEDALFDGVFLYE